MSDDTLAEAIARVEHVFADEPTSLDESGCGRCFTEAELALLRTAGCPVPAYLALQVSRKEPGHWDDQPSMIRRVLPALVAALADETAELSLTARGIGASDWQTWPVEQSTAVNGFLEAWWTTTLRRSTEGPPAIDVLMACISASQEVDRWLKCLDAEASRGRTADRHRAACLDDLEPPNPDPGWWWWGSESEEREALDTVGRWFEARMA